VLAPILIANFGGKQMQAMGRKSVTMPDGSRWEVRAATINLVGGSYDLIVVDELWNVSQFCVDDCLKPSQIAKKNSHLAQFSTAGDESSLAMIQTRETCLKKLTLVLLALAILRNGACRQAVTVKSIGVMRTLVWV
jgi:hypothetical protein